MSPKRLNVTNRAHLGLLQYYAHEHMSIHYALYIDSLVKWYLTAVPGTVMAQHSRVALTACFDCIDSEYLDSHIELGL